MPLMLCFDTDRGDFLRVPMKMEAQLPFVEQLPFTVADFLYPLENQVDVFWTERRALLALDELAHRFSEPFTVDGGFRRAGGTGCGDVCRRAGLCFDAGRTLSLDSRQRLRNAALETGAFGAAGAPYFSGRGIQLMYRVELPALQAGDKGVYVLAVQDALLRGGYLEAALSGVMDPKTMEALAAFYKSQRLACPNRLGARQWNALLTLTNQS